MINREVALMVDSLDAHKISRGLTLDSFNYLLKQFGYISKSEEYLAENVYHAMTGSVKDIHR